MNRYAIYGAGSLGTILGAYITKNGGEIDAINGIVCEWGRKTNIQTPINDRIVEIVQKLQTGELTPKADNICLFDNLL